MNRYLLDDIIAGILGVLMVTFLMAIFILGIKGNKIDEIGEAQYYELMLMQRKYPEIDKAANKSYWNNKKITTEEFNDIKKLFETMEKQ